jgi:hypothetical protein
VRHDLHHRPQGRARPALLARRQARSIDLVEGSKTKVGPLMLEPRATKQMWGFDRTHFAKVKPPPGYTRVYENHSWVVYASPSGCTGGKLAAPPGGDVQADSA